MNVVRRHSRCDTIEINWWQGTLSVCTARNERRPMNTEMGMRVRDATKLRLMN
jgi:hypothetical protein